jgi:hypothetical protein
MIGYHRMGKDKLLALYARAMWSAQRFERGLAALLSLYKTYSANEPGAVPFTDEEFTALLFGEDGRSARKELRELFREVKKYNQPSFPDQSVEDWLHQTVEIRNFLAHRYFLENGHAILDANARPLLGEQLDQCAIIFDVWQPVIEQWADGLMRALGLTDAQLTEIKAQAEQGQPRVSAETLGKLMRELEQISGTVS